MEVFGSIWFSPKCKVFGTQFGQIPPWANAPGGLGPTAIAVRTRGALWIHDGGGHGGNCGGGGCSGSGGSGVEEAAPIPYGAGDEGGDGGGAGDGGGEFALSQSFRKLFGGFGCLFVTEKLLGNLGAFLGVSSFGKSRGFF